jgi:ribosomal protein S18 acetylase RimI-like enzyme
MLAVVAISISDLERVAAGSWRAPEESCIGSWLLRAAGGFTGRANSALAIGDPGLPMDKAVALVRDWYQARDLPAMVSVCLPNDRTESSGVDRFLSERGWRAVDGAIVMTAQPELIAAQTARVDVADEPDQDWLALYRYRGHRPPPISRQLLMSAPWQAFASAREAGRTVAIGRIAGVLARGDDPPTPPDAVNWAGLTAVEVDPGCRRRGLGVAITRELAAAAVSRGVTGLYLQVAEGNAAARALYQQVGFADHHGYHYRIAHS